MNIVVANTYEEMSAKAADYLIDKMHASSIPLLCPPSGDTPTGLYKEFVNRYNQNRLDAKHWLFVSLDEWVGLNEAEDGSTKQSLNQQLFKPLQIQEKQICFFDGKAKNLEKECKRIDEFIEQKGGIDVCVLGLGMNGHVGLNEPGVSPHLHSHIVQIHPVTQKVGQKYFKQQQQLSQGITLGIATLLQSKYIILLVNGKHKSSVVKQVVEAPISEDIPATFLREHPNLILFLDADAASMLK